ncbi:PL29 family lyase N-terminal domain-containing protein [Phocaeicola sp.]|uniref:PL29 family lyase N-terminal domain-containing protein n=1 Tax=Phocaeicola sp. TaxID=2773926 RepID=UPI003AB724AF
MNKKFVGALLLGSLIMAGGTFTGCSDYDDDINSVNERVDEVRSTLEALQTQVNEGATISGVEKTDNGVVVTLSDGTTFELTNGKDGADGAAGTPGSVITIGENGNWFIDGKDSGWRAQGEKGEQGEQGPAGPQGPQGEPGTPGSSVAGGIYYYPGTEGEFEGFWVKVEIDAEGNKTETNSGVAWTNPVAGGVSVVWDIYNETLTVDGVEGGETVVINLSRILKALVFAPELYLDGVEATKYEYLDGNYVTLEGQVAGDYFDELKGEVVRYNIPDLNHPVAAGAYTLGSKDEVVYHMNPSSAAEDDYNYRFLYDNPEYISTRANGAGVKVNYLNKVKEDGDLKVTYQLEHPDLLAGKGGEHTESSNISVMALEAKTENASEEKTITSDYAALVPVVESLQAIAFIDHTTLENPACPKDLYNTGEEALKNVATLDWEYNGGTLDLSKLLQVHYLSQNWTLPTSGVHQSMGYDEVVKRYDLKWQYQMLPYTLGTNQTSESMYGMVDQNTGEFTPCMVIGETDDEGNPTGNGEITQQPIGEGSEDGVSAIGRRPIVLVTLENEAGDIVLAGYIKINITREMNEKDVVVDSWEAPYVCDGFSNTFSWADMSDEVIEMLHMSVSDFRDAYYMVEGETYIKNANDEMQLVSGNIYGEMKEHKDADVPTTNDVVEWRGGITELDNIIAAAGDTREFTLYAKFKSTKDGGINHVYVGMTIKVVEKPEVTFEERIDRYWYPESVAKEDRDTIRMNVPRPTNSGIASWDVMNYFKDIDEYYVGHQVQIIQQTQQQYYDLATLGTNYYFRFADTQDDIVAPDGTIYDLTINSTGSILYANNTVIAKIDPATGVLDYQDNAIAKEVLNLWGHAYPNTYAKVTLVATYDDCDLPLADETFNVRFLRPLDILPGNDANFIDAQANGSTVIVGDLFGLSDWRDQVLIVGTSGAYTSAVENGCPLYDYYHIENMKVLLDEVTCNLNGSWNLLSSVAPAVELSVFDARSGSIQTSGVATVDISGVSELNTSSITYRNNEANVRDFDMIIPVEIEYAWGTLKGEIKAHVDATMANE